MKFVVTNKKNFYSAQQHTKIVEAESKSEAVKKTGWENEKVMVAEF